MISDYEKNWQNFVHNVKWLRNHYEFSEDKMAEIMGISVDLFRELENGNGKDDLSIEVVFKIYSFFGVLPDMLFEDSFGEQK